MESTDTNHRPVNLLKLQSKDNDFKAQAQQHIDFVRTSVLKFYISDYSFFKTLPETTIFYKALKVNPETKKAICTAFELNIEAMCRYKRQLEKQGLLEQSDKKVYCKFTGHRAHLLTTNTFLFKANKKE
jgi:predicted transcriptional regulator